nr:PocR ligand-binding domain-containing protein [uncultured Caproiciproducens sp.]
MNDVKLTDVINTETLQKIQDAFAKATGMAALTVDLDKDVTKLSNPTDFCIKLTRGSKKGYERCNRCDLQGGGQAAQTHKPAVYYCHAGLMDFAAPIMVEGKQVGSLIGGQVLPEKPDLEKFRQIAHEIGVDEQEYLTALEKIKIVPKERIEAAAELLFVIANTLSEIGYQKATLSSYVEELIGSYHKLFDKVKEAEQCTSVTTDHINNLRSNFVKLQDSSDKSTSGVQETGSVIKYIKNVSLQTKLLGFNASIVAAREGEAGRSFGVIAQEIRALAESSSVQTDKIEAVLNDIAGSIKDIRENVMQTFQELDSDIGVIDELNQSIQQISEIASELNKLCDQLSK